jgi:hypothetical protein
VILAVHLLFIRTAQGLVTDKAELVRVQQPNNIFIYGAR